MSVSECSELSDNRLAFIAVFVAHTRMHMFEAEGMREAEAFRERYFKRRGYFPSIPPRVDDFPTVSRASYLSDTLDKLHVRTPRPRSG